MNYKSFDLGDWIGHISGIIEDETTLDGNEMRDLVEFLSTLKQEPGWIPVSEKSPEEREWIGTKMLGTTISDEVYVTFETPDGERFTNHLRFQNGKLSKYKQTEIDAIHRGSVPIAWMPLPKPYKAESEE